MQSKTSLFNKTLFLNNLKRHWPLWVIPAFFAAMLPLAGWFSLARYGEGLSVEDAARALYELVVLNPIPMFLYAPLCALAVWKYLFDSRRTGLMHTLPITRDGLFLTNWLSGMTMAILPYVPAGILYILISAVYGAFAPKAVLITIGAVIGHALIFFGMGTIFAFVSGTAASMILFYFVGNFLAVIMDSLLSTYAQGFLFGFRADYSGSLEFLSPAVYLMNNVHSTGIWREPVNIPVLEGGLTIVWYACAGVILSLAAWLMYRSRRSESAGDVVAVDWLKPVFKYGFAACVGLTAGRLLYVIFFDFVYYGQAYRTVPMCICLMIMTVAGYYAACMLLAKSFRVFRKNITGALVLCAAAVLLCIALRTDVLHVASKVPDNSDIETVYVRFDGDEYVLHNGTDSDLIAAVTDMHRAIAADREQYYYREHLRKGSWTSVNVALDYTLADGSKLYRAYELTCEDGTSAPDSMRLVTDLKDRYELRIKKLHLNDEFDLYNCTVYGNLEGTNITYNWSEITGRRNLNGLLEALDADRRAGADIFSDKDTGLYLELSFETVIDPNNELRKYDSARLNVSREMKNTLDYLARVEFSNVEG